MSVPVGISRLPALRGCVRQKENAGNSPQCPFWGPEVADWCAFFTLPCRDFSHLCYIERPGASVARSRWNGEKDVYFVFLEVDVVGRNERMEVGASSRRALVQGFGCRGARRAAGGLTPQQCGEWLGVGWERGETRGCCPSPGRR